MRDMNSKPYAPTMLPKNLNILQNYILQILFSVI